MSEPTEMKLREKYLVTSTYKFNGKKRKASNEGRTGKTIRAAKRGLIPGAQNKRKVKK